MRGPEVTEELFNKVKILKEVGGLSRQEIAKKVGTSESTVTRITGSKDIDEYNERKKNRFKSEKNDEQTNMMQDIHDLARETKNIKSILIKIAEAWDVKL